MHLFTDAMMADPLDPSLETLSVDAQGSHDHSQGPGSVHGQFVNWHTINDLEGSVIQGVGRIRSHPLAPGSIPIDGYIYDVRSGLLNEVSKATERGRACGV